MKKTFIIVLFFFTSLLTFGQVIDDFSDEDFTNNPVWTATPGNPSGWVIENGRLKSNVSVANSIFYITTPSIKATEAQWEFFINLQFKTSSANYADVYLVSELADLNSVSNNGYLIRIGGSDDEICLYKKVAGSANLIKLIDGVDGITDKSNNSFRIKVIRDVNSAWTLEHDETGGTNYILEGPETDNSFSSGNFFGVCIQQSTSSFFSKHFFDDFYAGDIIVDTDPPVIQSLQVVSHTELLLTFSENLNSSTAQNLTNYTINHSIGNPESAVLQPDHKSIKLSFAAPFPANVENEITLSDIKDLAGNVIAPASQHFTYTTAVFNDIVINELYPDPSPQVGLASQEFVEIHNKSNKTLNLAGWKLSDPTTTATLPNYQIFSGDYIILTNSSGIGSYTSSGKVIGVSNFPSLNNDTDKIKLTSADGLKIDSVEYEIEWYQNEDKADGGWTLERLDPQVNTNEPTNWRASEDQSGGTPGKQNSVFGKNPDIKVPELINLIVVSDKELLLEFNESLSSSSTRQSIYLVSNAIGNPIGVSLSGESQFVQLLFEAHFINGVDYELTLSGIQDVAGNTMPDLLTSFRYFLSVPSKFKDVIINEIMADPSPLVQLPEAEYIELFNRTNNPVDLKDWNLSDATGTIKLNSAVILPHDFIILTSTSNAYKFSNHGKAMGVSSFPSLNNGGESIVLKNSFDELIDSVKYSLNWYKDDERSDGGWSLELIDPENICGEGDNWISAEGENGGSPGKQNSVFANKPDLTGPKLIAAIANPNQVLLTFDEKLEKNTSLTSFKLSPEVSVSNAGFIDQSLRQVQLNLSSTLASRTSYEATVDLRDCAGNAIQNDFNRITFALPESADSLDIVINEILFNPKPAGVDFVEIHNHSPKFINLRNYKLANVEEGQVKNEQVITDLDLTLSPGAYMAFTEDAIVLKNNYPSSADKNFFVTEIPGLSDDEGSIVLVDDQNHIVDFLKYSEDYHSPLIKDDEGISLERISFTNATNDPSNWRSANASAGYATPGYLNSNARPVSPIDTDEIVISPEIFTPNAGFNDFASIQYKFEQGGYIANVKIYDQQGHPIKEISNNEAIPVEGAFRWDGDYSDGTRARNGYYMVWFEVFDLDGNVATYRKRVVLTSQN